MTGREALMDSRDELLRLVTSAEADNKWNRCCWWGKGAPDCVRRIVFRLATPHGHMDFCPEHIGYAIASLPSEWIDGWAYREPVEIGAGSDDIPF